MTNLIQEIQALEPIELRMVRTDSKTRRYDGPLYIDGLRDFDLEMEVSAFVKSVEAPPTWQDPGEVIESEPFVEILDLKAIDEDGNERRDYPEELETEIIKKLIFL